MFSNPKNENQIFERFLELPPELRMMIIDRMCPIDRCKFAACSYQCMIEAKKSKEFIRELELFAFSESHLFIRVGYRIDQNNFYIPPGFTLTMREESKRKYLIYSKSFEIELWRTELDNRIDLVQLTIKLFEKVLQSFQNAVRHLTVFGKLFETKLKDYDFGVRSLYNLEVLRTDRGVDTLQFLSKTRFPLKVLNCYESTSNGYLADCKQIYQVKKWLKLDDFKLNNEQFLRLSAEHIHLDIGELTENDIFNFIKSWKNGTFRKNSTRCTWNIKESSFDVPKLIRLLQLECDGPHCMNILIKNNDGKIANLVYGWDIFGIFRKLSFVIERR